MRRVDLYASHQHYRDHLEPIWQALPAEARGEEYSPRRLLPPLALAGRWPSPVLVASYADHMAVAPRPTIYVEHGAGQTYPGDPRSARHASYAGGQHLDRVRLFLAPSERVAAAWSDSYPTSTVAVTGSARLDQLAQVPAPSGPPRVAFTWHWDCRLIPETKSALAHYARALPRVVTELRTAGVELDGHGHPRRRDTAQLWGRLKVAHVPAFDTVVARSTVLVGDNSSVLYEWAALGRPVVVLNAPWYRRSIEHGLRFWSHVPGVQVDEPEQLVDVIAATLGDLDAGADLRSAATGAVYAHRGEAVARSVAAILEALA